MRTIKQEIKALKVGEEKVFKVDFEIEYITIRKSILNGLEIIINDGNVIKDEFLKKHNLTEADYRNLQRFERVRKSGIYNMYEYFGLMERNNLNGGTKLAEFIMEGDNYKDFLETLEKENKNIIL